MFGPAVYDLPLLVLVDDMYQARPEKSEKNPHNWLSEAFCCHDDFIQWEEESPTLNGCPVVSVCPSDRGLI